MQPKMRKEEINCYYEQPYILCLSCVHVQVLKLLHSSFVQGGPIYRVVVTIAEGMQTRHGDLTREIITKPLLGTFLKCLDSTGGR